MNEIWFWGVLGLVLLGLEMTTGTFYVLWFGISGLVLSFLVWSVPSIGLPLQLFLYSVFSIASLLIWKKLYLNNDKDSKVGQSHGEEIGRTGMVIKKVTPYQNGRIEFLQGLMGSREWTIVSDETIEVGKSAEIIAIEGNSLRVKSK